MCSLRTRENRQQNEKHENKRNQNQQPRNARVSILADEVKNPCPEKDIYQLNDKQQKKIWDSHMHASQL